LADYPSWVNKYKEKGTYINRVGNKYYLYAAHSERIKGTNKVRRISDGYLGRITEKDGLIPPKDKITTPIKSYEFGLSFAIISCTSNVHTGLRRTFAKYGDLIYSCSILTFIYGFHDRELFENSYVNLHFNTVVYPEIFTAPQVAGIERGWRMVSDTTSRYFGEDLPLMKAYLSNVHILDINKKLYISEVSANIQAFLEKHMIDWSGAPWQK